MKMKIALLTLGLVGAVFAAPYNKGDNTLTAGVGFGQAGVYGTAQIPPVFVNYDYGFTENISLGAIAGYSSSEQKILSYGWDFTYILVGARGAYHFNELLKGKPIDPYIGVLLGYNIVSTSTIGTPIGSAGASYLAFGGNLGARYWFTPKLGAQLELGYGVALASLGLTWRM